MTPALARKPGNDSASAAKAWARALDLTASIARQPDRILATVVQEHAAQSGQAPALLSDEESFTYSALAARANQYGRWALASGLSKGACVGLLMPNRPEYLAIWLGLSQIGCVVALLNTNLKGSSLAHCINSAAPKEIIVAAEFAGALNAAASELTEQPSVWIHGEGGSFFRRIDRAIELYSGAPLAPDERRPVTIHDRALYIYTSGTTGRPKAANVSHARVLQWSSWFAGMMDARRTDRMYDCLPTYHSVGGVLAPGAMLASGGSVVIRQNFSATHFWSDVIRWDCTLLQYIGELCRYLLQTEPSPRDKTHEIRMACGNGLSAEVWDKFKERFRIRQILEFYASTEGGVSLFNAEGKSGAIGRIPSYLAHRFSPALIKLDVEAEQPIRNEEGFCIPCCAHEIGEAIGPIQEDGVNPGSRFEGYTDIEASQKKILRNVFQPGDAWIRTGDLMRKDDQGFFYFVDRAGDTFRWKGENIATCEISEVLRAHPGVQEAVVYGVAIAGADGRAGMAALTTESGFELTSLHAHLVARLPAYARPMFIRIQSDLGHTGTFKYKKTDLMHQGFNPADTTDALYFNHPERQEFVHLDRALYEQIQAGAIRI